MAGQASPDGQDPVAIWQAYRQSLVDKDGSRALTFVTPATIDEYDRQVKLAQTLTGAELRKADPLDRFAVLMLRTRFGSELKTMSGSDVFRISIDKAWLGADLPSEVVLKRVTGAVAFVTFVNNGVEIEGELPLLRRLKNRWAVDLIEVTRLTKPRLLSTLTKRSQQDNTDLDTVMLRMIERTSGKKPPESVWEPPR